MANGAPGYMVVAPFFADFRVLCGVGAYRQLAEPRDQKDPVVRWPTVGSSAIPLRLCDLYPFFGYFQMKFKHSHIYYIGIFFTVFSLKLHHMSLLTSRLDASKCKSSREGFCPPRSKRPGADCNILSNQKRPKTTTTFRGCSKYILAVLAHTTTRTARVCVTVSIQLQQG